MKPIGSTRQREPSWPGDLLEANRAEEKRRGERDLEEQMDSGEARGVGRGDAAKEGGVSLHPRVLAALARVEGMRLALDDVKPAMNEAREEWFRLSEAAHAVRHTASDEEYGHATRAADAAYDRYKAASEPCDRAESAFWKAVEAAKVAFFECHLREYVK